MTENQLLTPYLPRSRKLLLKNLLRMLEEAPERAKGLNRLLLVSLFTFLLTLQ
jgi:hypothetical protein